MTPNPTTFFLKSELEGQPKWNICWDWEWLPAQAKARDPLKGGKCLKRLQWRGAAFLGNRMMACGIQMLLCFIMLAALPSDWLLPVAVAQDEVPDPTGASDLGATLAPDAGVPSPPPECREEQFPCTRLYSVHKPVKQCISYLCVTSVRRTYMINKEICSRIVCKEDEAMQEEICRQLAGLPPRRLRRSNRPRGPLCRRTQDQHQNGIKAQ